MNIPPYFYTQTHPDEDSLHVLGMLNGDLQREIRNLDPTLTPTFSLEKVYEKQGTFNYIISAYMLIHTMHKVPATPRRVNYCKALSYVEEKKLNANLSTLSPDQLLGHMNNLAKILGNPQSSFRDADLYIYEDVIPKARNAETFKEVDRLIKSRANKAQWETYKTQTRAKLWQQWKDPAAIPNFDEKDHAIMKLITQSMPKFELVPGLMKIFAEDFCLNIKQKGDVEEMMAWVHEMMIEIHPYVNCNGRLARLMMNLVRMHHGLQPLLIDNNENYLAAVLSHDHKVFAAYLKTLVAKQISVAPLVSECLRHLSLKKE